MPIEIVLLGWSVVLLGGQIALQSILLSYELGGAYNAGPRDAGKQVKGAYAGRAQRALHNLLETYPAFIGLALALSFVDKTGGRGALGAEIWFAARIVYVPLYLAGIPYLRSLVWIISALGLGLMLIALLL